MTSKFKNFPTVCISSDDFQTFFVFQFCIPVSVCKITPRCDRHVINSKVSEYNELIDEHFPNEDSLTVLPTIPLEASLLYKDNVHVSEKGLRQVSGIILSNLYRVLAPDSYKLKVVPIIKCTCTVFIDNFRNISTSSSI